MHAGRGRPRPIPSVEAPSDATATDACSLATPWHGQPGTPGYVEQLSLAAPTGSYYLAYDQAERWDLSFDIARLDDAMLRLSSFVDREEGALPWQARDYEFRIDDGDFPVGGARFRCRLMLSATIDGEPGPVAYYGGRR